MLADRGEGPADKNTQRCLHVPGNQEGTLLGPGTLPRGALLPSKPLSLRSRAALGPFLQANPPQVRSHDRHPPATEPTKEAAISNSLTICSCGTADQYVRHDTIMEEHNRHVMWNNLNMY